MNYNTANSTNYKLELVNSPELNYFLQSAPIPGISADGAEVNHKGNRILIPSDQVNYDPFSVDFLVDEDYANYKYLFNWVLSYAKKESPNKYLQDATLHILTANKTTNMSIRFIGLFPTMLGSIDLNSGVMDTSVILCNVTFMYQYFYLDPGV